MELRHFEYFVAVAEERNFTRAAARLHVVQSGVSAVIKALEHELGAKLLERTSKRVELTDAGQALLPRARAALEAAQAARDAVDEVRGGLRGTIRVGTLTSIPLIDMAGLLGEFHRRHPGVTLRLSVSPRGSVGLVEQLADGGLDLAFVSWPGRPPAGVRLHQVDDRPLDLVLPIEHRLATAGEVRIADLAGEAFVDFPAGYGNRIVVDRAFAAAGVQRQVAIEVTDISSAADFVREGLGVAIVPQFAVLDKSGLIIKRVRGADLVWPLGIATPALRRPSAATRALLTLIDRNGPTKAFRP
ncbi:LysR family transcriptional regulator [Paractinoplanes deccanensis]|uniref:LysR family transcriptional regulator n=1 Tax=Paractinoplanes deccanensis TaxID=113561 RepID=A0ABQ3YE13_9ACTN|nr:LysR family transcriptional regulator [Actinoplanes deccanensis]GID78221.1 LysR family transcriptional regulator [Actinoplanes deccanensis]